MSQVAERFIDELVTNFPGVRPVFDEHLSDNFGEVLPHLFFGDLTRYLVARFLTVQSSSGKTPGDTEEEVRSLLARLEQAYVTGGEELQELIAVSFLENLPRPGEEGSGVRNWLGPALTHQLRVIG